MSGGGVMQGVSGGSTLTHSVSDGTATSSAVAHGVSKSEALSHSGSLSTGYTADAKILGVGIGGGQTVSETYGLTQTSANTLTTTSGVTQSHTSGWSAGESSGWNAGVSSTWAEGGSSLSSTTTMSGHAETHGTADTTGGAHTEGEAWSVMRGSSQVSGQNEGWAVSRMWAHTVGKSESWGTTDTKSEQYGRSYAEGESVGQGLSRTSGQAFTGGFSTGLVPGVNVGRSWQTEDDVAERLTEILRQFEGLVNQAAAEGGFMTDALLLVDTDEGARAGETLVESGVPRHECTDAGANGAGGRSEDPRVCAVVHALR